MITETTEDCQSFVNWCKHTSDDVVEDVMQIICEGESKYGVTIYFTHQIDVINHVYVGEVEVEGKTWAFVVESGNRVGSAVYEWCHPDDAEGYNPTPPTIYTFVPRENLERTRPEMHKVYLAWTKMEWFREKERNYNMINTSLRA